MIDDKALEREFLTEFEALDRFRVAFTGIYPAVPLAREDPDVRRLLEAMAFFTARTRLAAQRTADASLSRLFAQHLPHAVTPSPAAAMLRARVTPRFVDPVELPRGVEALVSVKAGGDDAPVYRFTTTAPVRVLPIELRAVDLIAVRAKGYRFLLRFKTPFARSDEVGTLSLHLDHLDDLSASMAVMLALKTHLVAASVTTVDDVDGETRGSPCQVRFGAAGSATRELEAHESSMQRFRAFLQLPQAELFLHLDGVAPGRNWRGFTVCLDVDEGWPTDLRLTAESFVLHAVAAVNLRRDLASPFEVDGTRDRHLVAHPDPASNGARPPRERRPPPERHEAEHPDLSGRFVAHEVMGVYLMTGRGMEPLEPGVLGPTEAGYEVVYEGTGDDRRAWLTVDLPDAYDQPERVVVDVVWAQRNVEQLTEGELSVRLSDRHVEGLAWGLCGRVVPPSDSPLVGDRDALLALVALKGQRVLDADRVAFLLRAMGASRRPEFARLVAQLTRVVVTPRPSARPGGGVCHVYEIEFDRVDPSLVPALDLLLGRLLGLLEAWCPDQVVELVGRVPRLGRALRHAR